MPTIKLALVQVSSKLGQVEYNFQRQARIVADQRTQGADLVVFPELSLTGYQLKDLTSDVALTPDRLLDLWSGLGVGREIEIVCGYLEQSAGYQYYNAMAHLHIDKAGKAQLLHNHRKINLPTYGMFEEERYFSRGNSLRAYDSPLLGRCGLLICEDLWHPANTLMLALDGPKLEGVGVMIVGANSPARGVESGREEPANADRWRVLAQSAALTNNALVLVCQRVGVEDGFVYTGGSAIVGPGGIEIARAKLFDEDMLVADVDPGALIREQRIMLPGGAMDDYELLTRELKRIGRQHLDGE